MNLFVPVPLDAFQDNGLPGFSAKENYELYDRRILFVTTGGVVRDRPAYSRCSRRERGVFVFRRHRSDSSKRFRVPQDLTAVRRLTCVVSTLGTTGFQCQRMLCCSCRRCSSWWTAAFCSRRAAVRSRAQLATPLHARSCSQCRRRACSHFGRGGASRSTSVSLGQQSPS